MNHSPRTSSFVLCLSTSLAACAAGVAHAGFTFNTAPAPGGFLQACAGPSTPGSNPWPGGDFTTLFSAAGSDVDEQSFSGSSSASASASFSMPARTSPSWD